MSDSDTLAWKAVVGGSLVDSFHEGAVDTAVVALKTAGIWPKLDRLWLPAAQNAASALIDLKARSAATPVGSPVFTQDRGFTCNGSAIIDTNYNLSTNAVNLTAHEGHIACWNLTDTASGNPVLTASANFAIYPKYTDNNCYVRVNDSSAGTAITGSTGFFLGNRTDDFTRQAYRNGLSLITYGSTPAAANLPNTNLLVWDRQVAAISAGGPLTFAEQSAYYTIIRNYMVTMGVSVAPSIIPISAAFAGSSSLNFGTPRFASLQGSGQLQANIATALRLRQEAYVAHKRGLFIHFSTATYGGADFVPAFSDINVFNPTALDVGQWVDVAVQMGAKYAHLTVKHMDGFCLWPTTTTTRGIANTTWYAANGSRDITQEFVDACRARGVLPCFYFCVADLNYLNANPGDTPGFKSFTQAQISELLTRYGPIHAIWLDATEWYLGSATPWANSAERTGFLRGAQSDIIIVNNSHTGNLVDSDIIEYEQGLQPGGNTNPVECCFTFSSRWFWDSSNESMSDIGDIAAKITHVNSNNGTILINLPPNTAGVIPAPFVTRMKEVRKFLGELPRVSPNNMTGNSAPAPYVASASSQYDAAHGAYQAFNNLPYPAFWSSATSGLPQHIQIDLGSAKRVSEYSLQVRQDIVGNQPLDWTLSASADGIAWTQVDSRTSPSVAAGLVRFFNLPSAFFYRYWRWSIQNTVTATSADVGKLALFGGDVQISIEAAFSGGGGLSYTSIYMLHPPVPREFISAQFEGAAKLKLDIELFNSDFLWPRINEKAGSQVLWAQATGLEKAFADTDAFRLTRIYAELIRDQWDPVRISYRNLPYLAWAMGVNLWEDWWSEEFKRFWVAEQWTRKYERGSYLGLKNFTAAVGGHLKRAITPPAKTFPTPSLTEDERRAYLARFPQLRMYPYFARSQRPYNCILGGHTRSRTGKMFRSRNGGYVGSALRKMYPTAQTTGGRYQRTATIWDRGAETALTVRKIEKVITGTEAGWGFTPGVSAYDEEVVLPAKDRVFYYIGERRYLGANGLYGIYAGKQAALRTITVSRSGPLPFVQGQITYRTIAPSQQLMQLLPERVGQPHTTQKFRAFGIKQSSRGRFVHHCYPLRSEAWRFVYDRWYLFDADRVPDHRKGGQAYLGHTRLGIDNYTAEALIRVRTKYLRFNARCGGFVGHKTFLHKLNPEAINRLRRGVTASMALRDTVLINTTVTRKIQVRDIINPDGSHYIGELVEN